MQIVINSGDNATDELLDTIIAALNKYMMKLAEKQIYLAFEQAQKEVDDLHQRTREGVVTAKANGKQIGRVRGRTVVTKKSIAAKEVIKKHNKSFGGTLNELSSIEKFIKSRLLAQSGRILLLAATGFNYSYIFVRNILTIKGYYL